MVLSIIGLLSKFNGVYQDKLILFDKWNDCGSNTNNFITLFQILYEKYLRYLKLPVNDNKFV